MSEVCDVPDLEKRLIYLVVRLAVFSEYLRGDGTYDPHWTPLMCGAANTERKAVADKIDRILEEAAGK